MQRPFRLLLEIAALCAAVLSLVGVSPAVAQLPPAPDADLAVLARVGRDDGAPARLPIEDGGVLRSADAIKIRVRARRDGYVYVIAYGSSGRAAVVQPFSGNPRDALMRAGEERVIPPGDAFIPLDDQVGTEALFAVVTERPIEDLRRLLTRMEGEGLDVQAVTRVLRGAHPASARVAFRHIGATPLLGLVPGSVPAAPAPSSAPGPIVPETVVVTPANRAPAVPGAPDSRPGGWLGQSYEEPGVLSAAGSRIANLRGETPRAPIPATRLLPESPPGAAGERSDVQPGLATRLRRLFGGGQEQAPPSPAAAPPPAAAARAAPGASASPRPGQPGVVSRLLDAPDPAPAPQGDSGDRPRMEVIRGQDGTVRIVPVGEARLDPRIRDRGRAEVPAADDIAEGMRNRGVLGGVDGLTREGVAEQGASTGATR